MNNYQQSLKSLEKMDKETAQRAIDFLEFLCKREYEDLDDRVVSKIQYNKHRTNKLKELKYLKSKFNLK